MYLPSRLSKPISLATFSYALKVIVLYDDNPGEKGRIIQGTFVLY